MPRLPEGYSLTQEIRQVEKRACTVSALAAAMNIPYSEAYVLAVKAGRKPDHKFPFIKLASTVGVNAQVYKQRRRAYKAVEMLPKTGRYVLRVRGHVFAVVDGVVVDTRKFRPCAIVGMMWDFSKL